MPDEKDTPTEEFDVTPEGIKARRKEDLVGLEKLVAKLEGEIAQLNKDRKEKAGTLREARKLVTSTRNDLAEDPKTTPEGLSPANVKNAKGKAK